MSFLYRRNAAIANKHSFRLGETTIFKGIVFQKRVSGDSHPPETLVTGAMTRSWHVFKGSPRLTQAAGELEKPVLIAAGKTEASSSTSKDSMAVHAEGLAALRKKCVNTVHVAAELALVLAGDALASTTMGFACALVKRRSLSLMLHSTLYPWEACRVVAQGPQCQGQGC